MPNRSVRARWALIAAVGATAVTPAAAQASDEVVAELRVVGPNGPLEEGTSYVTNSERIRTDPQALCFFDGEGGSGDRVRLPGPTAMGLLETAGDATPAVNPLSVTDEYGFGLGLCGVGDVVAGANDFWNVKVNHQALQVGGDQFALEVGDEVLWQLTGFPPDPELQLAAAPGTTPGTMSVSVVRWICSTDYPPPDPVCTSEPAGGVTVTGADADTTTDGTGSATVTLATSKTYELRAANEGDLDSNVAEVCVSAVAGECPPEGTPRGRTIVGRQVADDFSATDGWDDVKSKGGDDRIRLLSGTDRVSCGGGRDKVIVDLDGDDVIATSCEWVKTLPG